MKMLSFILMMFLSVISNAQTKDSVLYFSSGKIQAEGRCINGLREGEWKSYYESGNLRMKGEYKNGELEGLWKSYFENGNKKRIEFYQNGKIGGEDYTYTGKNLEYYENGNLKEEFNWENGRLNGIQKKYYSDGTLKKEVNCTNGLFNGPMREFYQNKNIKAETIYINGKASTPSRTYYPNGMIKEEGPMKDGSYLQYDTLGNKIIYKAPSRRSIVEDKPVIYLYPEKELEISVNLDYKGRFLYTYPDYKNGWRVTAQPDGKIIDKDQKEYSYLFWEGQDDGSLLSHLSVGKGFVLKGEETQVFLQKTFSDLGLLPKEYNEFIVFWMPKMINNKYNYIYFLVDKEYDKIAKINIDPRPDAMRRVFMVFQPLKEKIVVSPQEFPAFKRKGFTVIEWGGSQVNSLIREF
jgi:antitoxin component YwqK of YwqJK toxin-antitoxin module